MWQRLKFYVCVYYVYVMCTALFVVTPFAGAQDIDAYPETVDVTGITLDQTRSVLGREFARYFSQERLRQYPLSQAVVTLKERQRAQQGHLIEIFAGHELIYAVPLNRLRTPSPEQVTKTLIRVENKLLQMQFAALASGEFFSE